MFLAGGRDYGDEDDQIDDETDEEESLEDEDDGEDSDF